MSAVKNSWPPKPYDNMENNIIKNMGWVAFEKVLEDKSALEFTGLVRY